MAALTIPEKIDVANASAIYASNELSGGNLNGGYNDQQWPILIYAVRQGVEWLYELDPTHEYLNVMSNYLIAICKWASKAELAIVGGGSTPSIINPAAPEPLDFIVAASGTPIIDGQTTVTISQFIGYNIDLFIDNFVLYTTNPGDGSTYYSWNRLTGQLVIIDGTPYTGQRIRVNPSR